MAVTSAYLPLWFADRGLTASEIGQVLGFGSVLRVVVVPGWGWIADRLGGRGLVLFVAAGSAGLAAALLPAGHGFAAILAISAIQGVSAAALTPLADSLTLQHPAFPDARVRTPLVLHQPKYSMLVRAPEEGLFDVLRESGVGCIVYSPLAQGLLTDRYAAGVPEDSRAAKPHGFLQADAVTEARRATVAALRAVAAARGQSVAQLALAWVLRDDVVTSALIGASSVAQLEQNVAAVDAPPLRDDDRQHGHPDRP